MKFLCGFLLSLYAFSQSALFAQDLEARLEEARKDYRTSAWIWTITGASVASLGLGIGVPTMLTAGDACKGVEGECYHGLGQGLAGLTVASIGVVVGGTLLTNGFYRFARASDYSEILEADANQRAALFAEEASEAKFMRYIGGGVASTIGLGLGVTPLILDYNGDGEIQSGTYSYSVIMAAPFLGLAAWSFLSPSISEDAYGDYQKFKRQSMKYDFDLAPTKSGLYAGLRVSF